MNRKTQLGSRQLQMLKFMIKNGKEWWNGCGNYLYEPYTMEQCVKSLIPYGFCTETKKDGKTVYSLTEKGVIKGSKL